jgi:hypothetical protein
MAACRIAAILSASSLYSTGFTAGFNLGPVFAAVKR